MSPLSSAAAPAFRHARLALIPLTLVALAAPSAPGSSQSPGAFATPSPGVVHLRNTGTAAVWLEVRVGMAEECEANDLLVRAALPAGGVWRMAGDTPVCWRELVARGSGGTLVPAGAWSRRTVARGATSDVVLTGPTSDDGAPE